jgi:hypothetical protein
MQIPRPKPSVHKPFLITKGALACAFAITFFLTKFQFGWSAWDRVERLQKADSGAAVCDLTAPDQSLATRNQRQICTEQFVGASTRHGLEADLPQLK